VIDELVISQDLPQNAQKAQRKDLENPKHFSEPFACTQRQ
jgi:hypothetical protein